MGKVESHGKSIWKTHSATVEWIANDQENMQKYACNHPIVQKYYVNICNFKIEYTIFVIRGLVKSIAVYSYPRTSWPLKTGYT